MLKNSLTKENLKSLKNYPVLESFLEDIKTNKDFTKMAEIVKDHLRQSVEILNHKEEILDILRILKLNSLKEQALEIQNKKGFLYTTYLDTIEYIDATQVFQQSMFEEVCALYDAEEPYEHLVYSSFAYFILKVDPYLTIFTLSPEKWLGKNGEVTSTHNVINRSFYFLVLLNVELETLYYQSYRKFPLLLVKIIIQLKSEIVF